MSTGLEPQKKTIADFYEEARQIHQITVDGQAEIPETGFVYVLSLNFFNFWKEKTNFELIKDGLAPDEDKTKMDIEIPRLNHDLIDWEETNRLYPYWRELKNLEWTQVIVKSELTERQDYEFINKTVWEAFKRYYPDAVEIKRPIYTDSLGRINYKVYGRVVEINLFSKDFIKEHLKENEPIKLRVHVFITFQVGEVLDIVLRYLRNREVIPAHFLGGVPNALNKDNLLMVVFEEPNSVLEGIISHLRNSRPTSYMLKDGKPVDTKTVAVRKSLQECRIHLQTNTYFLVEVKKHSTFFFETPEPEGSSDDDNFKPKKPTTPAKSPWGSNTNKETMSEEDASGLTDASRKGVVGLRNLGNTCYMNSALQCLSNCPDLTQYFLSKEFEKDKNLDNPLGSKCKLAEQYYDLMKKMWYGDAQVVSPSYFKYEISQFQSMFDGYGQHDSQELFSRVLDGLHEDLNRIHKKPYIESKDYSLEDDSLDLARQFWVNFLRRNYSRIAELFYGQYRCQIKCPLCGYVLVRYDPFELVTLPISKLTLDVRFSAFEISANHDRQAGKVEFHIRCPTENPYTLADVLEDYRKQKGGTHPNQYFLAFPGFSVHGDVIQPQMTLEDIHTKQHDENYKPKLFLFERTPAEIETMNQPDSFTVIALSIIPGFSKQYPAFSKMIAAVPSMTVHDLYYEIFLKFAHYVNLAGPEASITEDYPKPVEDYKALFSAVKESNLKTGKFFFTLMIANKILPIDDERKLQEVLDELEGDKERNPNRSIWNKYGRFLKVDLLLDKDIKTTKLVALDYMKKVGVHEIRVSLDNVEANPQKKLTDLRDLIKKFTKAETLDVNNMYNCMKCKEQSLAEREMSIFKVPKYLVFHLSKLKSSKYTRWGMSSASDNNLNITFPVEGFDMTEFVRHKTPVECYNIAPEEFLDEGNPRKGKFSTPKFEWPEDKPLLYDCIGVINHYGSMSFGHYTAYAKNGDNWYTYDDSTVTKMSNPQDIVTEAAYVIFYKRRD